MNNRVALIIGISGQTGSYLARFLLSLGYTVHGTSRDCERNSFDNLVRLGCRDGVVVHSLSAADFSGVMRLLREIRPDEIYNLAGQSSVALSFEQPIETFESVALSTLTVLECLRIHDRSVRFFNAASSDCFGHVIEPADEMTSLRPQSPYAMAKAASFWAVASYRKSYGLFASNGILSNHESPLRPGRFVTRKIIATAMRISQGSDERLRLGNLSVERDWGWAPDFAEAIWRITQYSDPHDFVVATGHTVSLEFFVDAAFSYFGLDWRKFVDINPGLYRPSDIPRVALNPSKAHRLLNWSANVVMPGLVNVLMECEISGCVGPMPWS